jgi:VanZ family protein
VGGVRGDPLGHLAVLRGARRDAVLAFVLAVLLACADESIQHFTVGRGASVLDVVLDSAGAGGALLLAASFQKRRRAGEIPSDQGQAVVGEVPRDR